jgi:hypothetical protein
VDAAGAAAVEARAGGAGGGERTGADDGAAREIALGAGVPSNGSARGAIAAPTIVRRRSAFGFAGGAAGTGGFAVGPSAAEQNGHVVPSAAARRVLSGNGP